MTETVDPDFRPKASKSSHPQERLGCDRFDQFRADFRRDFRSRSQPVPEHDRDQRKQKDDSRDGVDLWSDPTPQSSPDFERQRVVAADQEEAYGDFVQG